MRDVHVLCKSKYVALKSGDRQVQEWSEASLKDTKIAYIHIYPKAVRLRSGIPCVNAFFSITYQAHHEFERLLSCLSILAHTNPL